MKFCFIAPYYSEQSNGIRVLYQAALLFSQHAKQCILHVYDSKTGKIISHPDLGRIPRKFHRLISNKPELSIDAYYVIPETPSELPRDLPKNAKIVRYLLANPFFFNREKVNLNNQFLLAYSYAISDKLPQLFIEALPDLKKQKKKIDNKKLLIYFGKFRLGQSFNFISQLNQITEGFKEIEIIHRGYPKDHKEYLNKLRSADCLVCYDGFTSVIHEASLMGIPVIVVDDLRVKKKFHITLRNIVTLNELANKKQSFINYESTKKKDVSVAKPDLNKIFKLINQFFNSEDKNLDSLFNREIKKMQQHAKRHYSQGILNFNSDLKLFFLLLFLFDKKAYFEITVDLNKIRIKFIQIILTPIVCIYYLRLRCFNFIFMSLVNFVLFKFYPKAFILKMNEYIKLRNNLLKNLN